MYEFIDRLVNIALPRIKDFLGLSVNGFETSKVHLMGLPDEYIQHGSKEEILKQYKMDVASVIAKLEEYAK